MLISELRFHPVAIADGPLRSSYGLHAPYALRTIVELKTTDGITGISETYGGDAQIEALEQAREHVLGMDPFAPHPLLAVPASRRATLTRGRPQPDLSGPRREPSRPHTRTFAAIEVACLDVIGKAVNKPLCDLTGGRARDLAPFSAYLFYKHGGGGGIGRRRPREDEYGECLDPASIVRQAQPDDRPIRLSRDQAERGRARSGGRDRRHPSPARRVRARVPATLDPNCAWSVETSVQCGRVAARELTAGGYLEDPTATLEGMAEVRRRLLALGNRYAAGEQRRHHHFRACAESVAARRRADRTLRPALLGRHPQPAALSHLCQVLGLGVSMHSNNHLGISMMTMAHAAAASEHLTHACDTHYPWQTDQDEVVAGGRVPIRDGKVVLSKTHQGSA